MSVSHERIPLALLTLVLLHGHTLVPVKNITIVRLSGYARRALARCRLVPLHLFTPTTRASCSDGTYTELHQRPAGTVHFGAISDGELNALNKMSSIFSVTDVTCTTICKSATNDRRARFKGDVTEQHEVATTGPHMGTLSAVKVGPNKVRFRTASACEQVSAITDN
jgi:hypothetical protein